MKLCIVGNSHVASLQRAWSAWPEAERPALEITTFAARHRLVGESTVTDGRLVPDSEALRESFRFTSGGQDEIDLRAYDAVLVYGLFVPAYPGPGGWCSAACQAAALADFFDPRLGVGVARAIRGGTRAPVLIGHDPLPCDPAREAQGVQGPDRYAAALRLANAGYFAPLGLEMLEQPAQTRVGPAAITRGAYARGSRRLAIGDGLDDLEHERHDRRHMNAEFGRIWLEMLVARLGLRR